MGIKGVMEIIDLSSVSSGSFLDDRFSYKRHSGSFIMQPLISNFYRENIMKKAVLVLSLCLLIGNLLYGAARDPVAVLYQVKGKVEYSKNGKKWKRVRHSKFLFTGYKIRTGTNGKGVINVRKTGKNLKLGPNSLIVTTSSGPIAKKGTLVASRTSGKLLSGLIKRFTKSQSYTTIRRSSKKKGINLDAVRNIALTDDFPHLVWSSLGGKYDFELTVGSDVYKVPATRENFVRVKVKPFLGKKTYHIKVLRDRKVVAALQPFRSKGKERERTIVWLSDEKKEELRNSITGIQDLYGDNSFIMGSYFEKNKMWVAAMDKYKQYLSEYPDEIEMTPYLFRVYKKLRLNDLYRTELAEWTKAVKQ